MRRGIEIIETAEAYDNSQAEYMEIAHTTESTRRTRMSDPGLETGMFQGHGTYGYSYALLGRASAIIKGWEINYWQQLSEGMAVNLKEDITEKFDRAHHASQFYGHGGAVGTTIAAHENNLYVAYLGDIQAHYAARSGDAHALTAPHDATNNDEVKRFVNAGGWLSKEEDEQPFFGKWRISRSIGDHDAPEPGLSATPEFSSLKLEDPGLLIMATRGVWQAFSPEAIRDYVYETGDLKATTAEVAAAAATDTGQNVGLQISRFDIPRLQSIA